MATVFKSFHGGTALDDANHKLDASVRFVCSRQLYRRIAKEARLRKRRTISEWLRELVEAHFEAQDARERVPGG